MQNDLATSALAILDRSKKPLSADELEALTDAYFDARRRSDDALVARLATFAREMNNSPDAAAEPEPERVYTAILLLRMIHALEDGASEIPALLRSLDAEEVRSALRPGDALTAVEYFKRSRSDAAARRKILDFGRAVARTCRDHASELRLTPSAESEAVLAQFPGDPAMRLVRANLAVLYGMQGRLVEGIKILEELLPTSPPASDERALLLKNLVLSREQSAKLARRRNQYKVWFRELRAALSIATETSSWKFVVRIAAELKGFGSGRMIAEPAARDSSISGAAAAVVEHLERLSNELDPPPPGLEVPAIARGDVFDVLSGLLAHASKLSRAGRFLKALWFAEPAAELAAATEAIDFHLEATIAAAHASFSAGLLLRAAERFSRALSWLSLALVEAGDAKGRVPQGHPLVQHYIHLELEYAIVLLTIGDIGTAAQRLTTVRSAFDARSKFRHWARATLALADAALCEHNHTLSLQLYEEVVEAAHAAEHRDVESSAIFQWAQTLEMTGQVERAIDCFARAVELGRSLRRWPGGASP